MYGRILIAYDGSASAKRALQETLKLAKDQHAAVHVVHVLDESPFYRYPAAGVDIEPLLDAWRQGGEDILKEAVSTAEQEGIRHASPRGSRFVSDASAHREQGTDSPLRLEGALIVLRTTGRGGHGL